jgi:uncharacterized cupin superfamily protein
VGRFALDVIVEARLEDVGSGLAPVSEGWFVVNVRDTAWETSGLGSMCAFEGFDVLFSQLGINVRVLTRESGGLHHSESNQENFLVVAGECLLLVAGEERPLKAWDFVHCPPGTEHAFVVMSKSPCVIIMIGARTKEPAAFYPRSELALRHGVGVDRETTSPGEAQAGRFEWQYARPEGWAELPWS